MIRDLGGNVVVSAAQILNGGRRRWSALSGDVHSAHRTEPGLQPSVICFDRVVRVLLDDVQRRRDQLVEDPRINGRAVGRDLYWDRARAQCPGEEAPRRRQVTSRTVERQ